MTTTPQELSAPLLSGIAGRRIRGLRAELGLSQSALILQTGLGLSRAAMSERETGVKPVPVDELPSFASVLGVSVAYLMGFTDDRSRPLEEAAADALRACRDSNPKPSDLESRRLELVPAGVRERATVAETILGADARVIRFPLERRRAS